MFDETEMVTIIEVTFILMYFGIIALVVEISTILLKMTGLDKDIARFQAISMLTGTGFTTGESELVARHPLRRKLAAFLILFGAFSLAVIISALSSLLANRSGIPQLGFVMGVLIVILIVTKMKKVQERLTTRLEADMQKVHVMHELPIEDVLFVGKDDMCTEVHVFYDSKLIGECIGDCIEGEADINVLFIKRGDEVIRRNLSEVKVQEGDVLLVYGDRSGIERVFEMELEHMEELEEGEDAEKLLR